MLKISRKKFILGAVVAGAGAGACLCGLNGCATLSKIGGVPAIKTGACIFDKGNLKIVLSKVPELKVVGGSVKVIDSRLVEPVIIVRTGESDYAVVSIKCPHRGVEVEYRHKEQQFRCASLGHSTFKLDGSLKRGLAKKALTRYDAIVDSADPNCLVIANVCC